MLCLHEGGGLAKIWGVGETWLWDMGEGVENVESMVVVRGGIPLDDG